MAKNISVFVDSDVVISSLLSTKGAAYLLISQSDVTKTISNYSVTELESVTKRLNISPVKLKVVIKDFDYVEISSEKKQLEKHFAKYVTDLGDAHIIAAAAKAKTRFLLTYNLKHYVTYNIKNDLGIIVFTPAQFLQYFRSLG